MASANMSEARAEWDKYGKVDGLLHSVTEYMDIYNRLRENNQLIELPSVTPSNPPRHAIPDDIEESKWEEMDLEEKTKRLYKQANETMDEMMEVGKSIEEELNVKFVDGPLKKEDRVLQKCREDYEGDILRVIDLVRCSFVFVFDTFAQAKQIIDDLNDLHNAKYGQNWSVLRLKNGFEKPENFMVGGYRDIKINVQSRKTGHVIEIQLHLRDYYELKKKGGHKHYEFARQQKISGITSATQIINHNLLHEIVSVGLEKLEGATNAKDRAYLLRQLGDIEMAVSERNLIDGEGGEQAAAALRGCEYYYKSFLELDSVALTDAEEDRAKVQRALDILTCEVMTGLSYAACVYEYNYSYGPDPFPGFPEMIKPDNPSKPFTEEFLMKVTDGSERYGIKFVRAKAEKCLGSRHPLTLRAMSKQAFVSYCFDMEECLRQYLEIVCEMEKVLGKDHPETIDARTQLGATHCTISSYGINDGIDHLKTGYECFLEALEPALRVFGTDHTVSVQLVSLVWRWMEPQKDWVVKEYPTIFAGFKKLLKAAKKPKSEDNPYWRFLELADAAAD